MEIVKEEYSVAGVAHRQHDIADLLAINPDYQMSKNKLIDAGYAGRTVYKFKLAEMNAALQPEPENIHDPNAVKVMLAGVHVGYIPAVNAPIVKRQLAAGRITEVVATIGGGPRKSLDEIFNSTDYKLVKEDMPVWIQLEVVREKHENEPELEQKYCKNCGKPITDADRYCLSCGRSSLPWKERTKLKLLGIASKLVKLLSVLVFGLAVLFALLAVYNAIRREPLPTIVGAVVAVALGVAVVFLRKASLILYRKSC